MTIDYDRKCDMATPRPTPAQLAFISNCLGLLDMREPGVEPGCPKAPDPKGGPALRKRELWCPLCRRNRERKDFAWGPKRRAGYCRECQAAAHTSWRKTQDGKRCEAACAVRSRHRHADKVKARNALYQEIRKGRMVKGPCESHGPDCRGRIEAHHDDYSRPLDVRWTCQHHHRVVDGARRLTGKEGNATERHPAPPNSTRTVAESTTSRVASPVSERAGLATALRVASLAGSQ